MFGAPDLATVEREFQRMREEGRTGDVLMPGMSAFFQDTIQITSLETPTSSINVVPQQASALVDLRLLPDTPVEDMLERMREALGTNPSIEVLLSSPPTPPSPVATELYAVLERTLGPRSAAGAVVHHRHHRLPLLPRARHPRLRLLAVRARRRRGARHPRLRREHPDRAIPRRPGHHEKGRPRLGRRVTRAVALSLPLAVYATVLGLISGSYLNVVIHRLPRGVSTVLPPSSCPGCGSRIRARDNIPVFSFLLAARPLPQLRALDRVALPDGRSRHRSSLPRQLPALRRELERAGGRRLRRAMIALALIDLEHFILPDRITIPGIVVGLLVQPLVGWVGLPWALVGAAVGAGVILAMNAIWLAIRGVQGFGYGDVKMLAMIGAFLGLSGVVVTLFLAALLGSVTGIALMARKRIHLQSKLPFGFFLSIGAIAALFYGRAFVDWYLSFFP